MALSKTLRLGTRASALAQWQAKWVADRLAQEGADVELVPITTGGDAQQVGPIGAIGTQGVFTKEIQKALLSGSIDLAVHSLKDLPTERVEGLSLAAVPLREEIADALVCPVGFSLASCEGAAYEGEGPAALKDLPRSARIGTGSLRRKAQLLCARSDLQIVDIRGNVDTRLRRLDEGEYDAAILAVAGLVRLGLSERICQRLPLELMLPAVGQGALGIETRTDDSATRSIVGKLDHWASHLAVLAERAMLAALRGGCLAPVGAWGRLAAGELCLTGIVLSIDGKKRLLVEESVSLEVNGTPTVCAKAAEALGSAVAQHLLGQGAAELIAASREL